MIYWWHSDDTLLRTVLQGSQAVAVFLTTLGVEGMAAPVLHCQDRLGTWLLMCQHHTICMMLSGIQVVVQIGLGHYWNLCHTLADMADRQSVTEMTWKWSTKALVLFPFQYCTNFTAPVNNFVTRQVVLFSVMLVLSCSCGWIITTSSVPPWYSFLISKICLVWLHCALNVTNKGIDICYLNFSTNNFCCTVFKLCKYTS